MAGPSPRPSSTCSTPRLGGLRSQKHRRLAHAACNHARNEFRMQAERQFKQWIAERQASAKTLTDK
jgi:hypothetical protein